MKKQPVNPQSLGGRMTSDNLGTEGRQARAAAGAAARWGSEWTVVVQDRSDAPPVELYRVRAKGCDGLAAIRAALKGQGWRIQWAQGISGDNSTTAVALSKSVVAQAWLAE